MDIHLSKDQHKHEFSPGKATALHPKYFDGVIYSYSRRWTKPPAGDVHAIETLGNPGWNWDLLKKYFDKSSGFIPPSQKGETVSYDITQRNADGMNLLVPEVEGLLTLQHLLGPVKYSYPMVPSGFEGAYQKVHPKLFISPALPSKIFV